VRGYRGGYLPRERREIERGLREGDIRAVVATNALELGIDIGSLDTVVMAGYPGTIASTWQRAGRAGRRQTTRFRRAGGFVAPLDQYIVEHPDYFFDATARARLTSTRQPGDPAQPPEVRGVRAARARRREVRTARRPPTCAASWKRSAAAPFGGRVALDVGHLPRRRHQPARGDQRQLRRHRHRPASRR
jgi:superfamily II DNA or RNA helicase